MRRKFEVVGYGLFISKTVVAVAALMILTLVPPAAAQSFTDPVTYTLTGENPGRAATGDLDGDGDADIAVPTLRPHVPGSRGYVEVLLDLEDGSSAAPTVYVVGSDPTSVVVADLDGDGDLDLAVANRGDGTVSVLANRGDGTFWAAVDYAAGSSPFVVVAGDLNGDGVADLAVASTSEVSWLANDGSGTFAAPQSYPFTDTIVGLDVGEMEGDSDLDLVVLEKSGGTTSTLEAWVTVLSNDGFGTFASSPRYEGGSWSDGADYDLHPSVDALALGDVDSNGYLDVLIGANTGWSTLPLDGSPLGRVHVLINSAGDLMPGEHRGSCHDVSPQLDTGDLDSDVDPDVVTGSVYFLNDGTGHFGDAQDHGGDGDYVTVDDLYADGLPDLVLPQDPYSVQVLFQGDVCPGDPNKTDPGQCGCGQLDTDSDADGVADCIDRCPGEPDTDSDGDRVPDCLDQCPGGPDNPLVFTLDTCPNDPNKTDPGQCGCGEPDIDSDGDGVMDCVDVCQGFDDTLDCNGNEVPDGCDIVVLPFDYHGKLTASDGATGDYFGANIAMHGDAFVVGATADDDQGTDSGSVYVYRNDGSGTWNEEDKLTASDGAPDDSFGRYLSIHDDTIAVGVWGDDDPDQGTDSGSVYVYRNDGSGTWIEEQKLTAFDGAADDQFGEDVSIHGYTIAVGAWGDDDRGDDSGSVYVFRYNAGSWSLQQKLTASDGVAGAYFGRRVAIHGDTMVVGAFGDDSRGDDSGSVYVYRYDGSGTWDLEQKLTASDGAPGDHFGIGVSTDGEMIVVGAFADDNPDQGINSGSVYVFRYDGSGPWNEEDKLTASDGAASDLFGESVSTDGETIVVGAFADDDRGTDSGSVYVYRYDGSGTWDEEPKLTAPDGADWDEFGVGVAVDGGTIVAGAWRGDGLEADSGSVYTFERPETSSDCDGDGVPDECQPDTDLDGLIDACDGCPFDPGKIDPDDCGCGLPDTDSDRDGIADCVDPCAAGTGNPVVFVLDLCFGDPNKIDPGVCGCGQPEIDSDGDGHCVTGDCDDASTGSWATPGEVAGLQFGAGTKDELSWDVPAEPGGDAPRYDTVRSDIAGDFGAAMCIESDDASDRTATDVAIPAPGSVFHYLVRAENDCPMGQGTVGHDSQGAERSAPICP